ncbi:MAG: NUDIX hydrolase [Chitinophagales bacterium]
MIEVFAERLKQKILDGLPGIHAQQKMAPTGRHIKSFEEEEFPEAKKASVLILFYPFGNEIFTVLMKRPDYEGVHSGQVSFPGGKIEDFDRDAAAAALREAEEELGIQKQTVQLIGKLSNVYIPPSNFFVFPFAGYTLQRPDFNIDVNEVVEIVETPVSLFSDQSIKGEQEIVRGEVKFKAPFYRIGEHKIWGATAIILSELEMML